MNKKNVLATIIVIVLALMLYTLPFFGVFIAPRTGTKYHAFRFCKGLRKAVSVVQVPKVVGAEGRNHCLYCEWMNFLEWR